MLLPTEIRIIEMVVLFVALYITVFYALLYFKHESQVLKKPRADPKFRPKVSVVVPAYNEADTLPRCIESLLALDYPKNRLEIIVVDDGSTDNTYEVAKKYEKRGVRAFTKPNGGNAAGTKNYGIKRATGDIIATLDADSYVTPSALKNMLPYFSDPEVMAVTASVKAYSHRGSNFLTSIQRTEYIFTLFSRKMLSFIDAVNVTPGPFSLFRRKVFDRIGYFDEKNILEDQEFAMRMQKHNMKICSAMDADVYTEVPYTFGELLKQRIRWHRGGLHNSLKYLEMIGPRYGDMGMIVMPLTLVAVTLLFAVFIMVGLYWLFAPPYALKSGAFLLMLNLNWTSFVGMLLFFINLWWIYMGIQYFREEGISGVDVILYVISYSYLVTLFWLAAFAKEAFREKMTW
ncbi:MAG: glycosyltransferase family 2 protein [Candidatus Micrarchaeia archaeon]